MGIVVSGGWLHIIAPVQTAALMPAMVSSPRLWHREVASGAELGTYLVLTLGTAIGIPIGVMLLTRTNPTYFRRKSAAHPLRDVQLSASTD
jgi:uncharacterized protein